MKKIGLVCFGWLAAGVCFGQQMDSFDSHVADFRLLVSKRVQADVGVTKAQVAQLNVYADHNRAEIKDYQAKLIKQGKDPRQVRDDDPTLVKFFLELQKNILEKLTPQQLRRLRELTLQSLGLRGMLDLFVAKRVGLSDAQLKKAREIFQVGYVQENKIREEIHQRAIAPYVNVHPKSQEEAKTLNEKIAADEDARLKLRADEVKRIVDQTKRALDAVITPKQYKAYSALEGKKFEAK